MKNKTIHLFVFSTFFLFLFALLNPIYACSPILGYTSIQIECGIENFDNTDLREYKLTQNGETITISRNKWNDSGIEISFVSNKIEQLGRLTPGVKIFLQDELKNTLETICTDDISYLQDNLIEDLETRVNPNVYPSQTIFYTYKTQASEAEIIDQVNSYDQCNYPKYEIQDQWIIGTMDSIREYCTNRGLCGSPQINAGDYLPFLLTNIDQQTFPYLVKHLLHLTPLLIFAISVPASLFYMFKTKRFLAYFIISVLTTPLTFFVLILLNYSWIIDSDFFNTKNEMLMSPFLLGSVVYLLWVWWREKVGKGKKGMN